MRELAAMLLLVLGPLVAFGGSVQNLEDCRQLLEADENPLSDEISLSDQVRTFLDSAPESLFIAIGTMFLAEIPPITDPLSVQELKNYYGTDWAEVMRRKTILEASRLLVTEAEWEQIWPYYANVDFVDFLARALVRLKAGHHPMLRLKPNEMRRRLCAHLRDHYSEIPDYELMLAHSKLLQSSFVEILKAGVFRFGVDLTLPAMQQSMARMLREGKLGDQISFIEGWVAVIFQKMRGDGPPPLSFAEYTARKENAYPGFFEQLGDVDSPVRSFIYKAMMWAQTENPSYSAPQVRQAILDALKEHDEVIAELNQLHLSEQQALTAMASEFAFQAPKNRGPQTAPVTNEFSRFAQDEMPIDQLRAERDYPVRFIRQIGHRCRIQRVRFTQRAVTGLRSSWLTTGVPPSAWLKAIQLGPAACHNSDGIKLMQISPLRGFDQMNLEVKKRTTPWRLYGFRDATGRFVFDLFLQNK